MASTDLKIKSPRRVLFLSVSDALASDSIKDLTGTAPIPLDHGLSGVSHTLWLKTAYYEADVPIWIDILDASKPDEWAKDFLNPEALEVLMALGGYVLVLPKPIDAAHEAQLKEVVKAAGSVVKAAESKGWDGVPVCVLTKQDVVPCVELRGERWDRYEDFCADNGGWELIDGEAARGSKNEFGEKLGWERVREALEANNWDGGIEDDDLEGLEDMLGLDDMDDLFGDGEQMSRDTEGIRQAIYGGGLDRGNDDEGNEKSVEEMEGLMLRMQAMRDWGADMPEAERRRFAAKAVKDLMRDL